MKSILKFFRALLSLAAVLVLLPQLAQASMTPAQYPWPWPWAIGCPIRWSDIEGSHPMSESLQGDTFKISLSHTSKKSMIGVHIRRMDAAGVHSDGYAVVGQSKRVATVKMMSYRSSQDWYLIQIRMGLYQTTQNKRCEPDRMKTVVTIFPNASRQEVNTNYVLDPSAQK